MKSGYLLEAKDHKRVTDLEGRQFIVPKGTTLFCTSVTRIPSGNHPGERTELTLYDAVHDSLFVTHPFWLKIISKN